MIYDGHAYIFPDVRGDGGFDDPREFKRHLQLAIATHFMPRAGRPARPGRCGQ